MNKSTRKNSVFILSCLLSGATLLLACLLGIVFGLATQKRRAARENAQLIPWGPSIAAAAILTLLFGDAVTSAYLSLF